MKPNELYSNILPDNSNNSKVDPSTFYRQMPPPVPYSNFIKWGSHHIFDISLSNSIIYSVFPLTDYYTNIEKNISISGLNFDFIAITSSSIIRFDKEKRQIKEISNQSYSVAVYLPYQDIIVAISATSSHFVLIKPTDLKHPIETEFRCNQFPLFHISYFKNSKCLITTGNEIKIWKFEFLIPSRNLTINKPSINIKLHSTIETNIEFNYLNSPCFDYFNELIITTKANKFVAYNIDGNIIKQMSSVPMSIQLSASFLPNDHYIDLKNKQLENNQKVLNNNSLNIHPINSTNPIDDSNNQFTNPNQSNLINSTNQNQNNQLNLTNQKNPITNANNSSNTFNKLNKEKILNDEDNSVFITADSENGICEWSTKGQIKKRHISGNSSILTVRLINKNFFLYLDSKNNVYIEDMRSSRLFLLFQTSDKPNSMCLFKTSSLSYSLQFNLVICINTTVSLYSIVIPWRLFSPNITKPKEIQLCTQKEHAARILIQTCNSDVYLISPRDGQIISSACPENPKKLLSSFYDRGMYSAELRDQLFIVNENGQILCYQTNSIPCEFIASFDIHAVNVFIVFNYFNEPLNNQDNQLNSPSSDQNVQSNLSSNSQNSQLNNNLDIQLNYCVATENGELILCDYNTFEFKKRFLVQIGEVKSAYYDIEYNTVLLIFTNSIIRYDFNIQQIRTAIPIETPLITQYSKSLLILGYTTGQIDIYTIQSTRIALHQTNARHTTPITSISFGKNYFITSSNSLIVFFNLNGSEILEIELPFNIYGLATINHKRDLIFGTDKEIMLIEGQFLFIDEFEYQNELIDNANKKVDEFDLSIKSKLKEEQIKKKNFLNTRKIEVKKENKIQKVPIKIEYDEEKRKRILEEMMKFGENDSFIKNRIQENERKRIEEQKRKIEYEIEMKKKVDKKEEKKIEKVVVDDIQRIKRKEEHEKQMKEHQELMERLKKEEEEHQKQLEIERLKEIERQKGIERQIEIEKQKELERLKELEKQKELERLKELEKQKEIEKQKEKESDAKTKIEKVDKLNVKKVNELEKIEKHKTCEVKEPDDEELTLIKSPRAQQFKRKMPIRKNQSKNQTKINESESNNHVQSDTQKDEQIELPKISKKAKSRKKSTKNSDILSTNDNQNDILSKNSDPIIQNPITENNISDSNNISNKNYISNTNNMLNKSNTLISNGQSNTNSMLNKSNNLNKNDQSNTNNNLIESNNLNENGMISKKPFKFNKLKIKWTSNDNKVFIQLENGNWQDEKGRIFNKQLNGGFLANEGVFWNGPTLQKGKFSVVKGSQTLNEKGQRWISDEFKIFTSLGENNWADEDGNVFLLKSDGKFYTEDKKLTWIGPNGNGFFEKVKKSKTINLNGQTFKLNKKGEYVSNDPNSVIESFTADDGTQFQKLNENTFIGSDGKMYKLNKNGQLENKEGKIYSNKLNQPTIDSKLDENSNADELYPPLAVDCFKIGEQFNGPDGKIYKKISENSFQDNEGQIFRLNKEGKYTTENGIELPLLNENLFWVEKDGSVYIPIENNSKWIKHDGEIFELNANLENQTNSHSTKQNIELNSHSNNSFKDNSNQQNIEVNSFKNNLDSNSPNDQQNIENNSNSPTDQQNIENNSTKIELNKENGTAKYVSSNGTPWDGPTVQKGKFGGNSIKKTEIQWITNDGIVYIPTNKSKSQWTNSKGQNFAKSHPTDELFECLTDSTIKWEGPIESQGHWVSGNGQVVDSNKGFWLSPTKKVYTALKTGYVHNDSGTLYKPNLNENSLQSSTNDKLIIGEKNGQFITLEGEIYTSLSDNGSCWASKNGEIYYHKDNGYLSDTMQKWAGPPFHQFTNLTKRPKSPLYVVPPLKYPPVIHSKYHPFRYRPKTPLENKKLVVPENIPPNIFVDEREVIRLIEQEGQKQLISVLKRIASTSKLISNYLNSIQQTNNCMPSEDESFKNSLNNGENVYNQNNSLNNSFINENSILMNHENDYFKGKINVKCNFDLSDKNSLYDRNNLYEMRSSKKHDNRLRAMSVHGINPDWELENSFIVQKITKPKLFIPSSSSSKKIRKLYK